MGGTRYLWGRISDDPILESEKKGAEEYLVEWGSAQEIAARIANDFEHSINMKLAKIFENSKDAVSDIMDTANAKLWWQFEEEIIRMIKILECMKDPRLNLQRAYVDIFEGEITKFNIDSVWKTNLWQKTFTLLKTLSKIPEDEREVLIQKYTPMLRSLNSLSWEKLGFWFDRYIESVEQWFTSTWGHPLIWLYYTLTTHIEMDLSTLAVNKRLERVFTDSQSTTLLNDWAQEPVRRRGLLHIQV